MVSHLSILAVTRLSVSPSSRSHGVDLRHPFPSPPAPGRDTGQVRPPSWNEDAARERQPPAWSSSHPPRHSAASIAAVQGSASKFEHHGEPSFILPPSPGYPCGPAVDLPIPTTVELCSRDGRLQNAGNRMMNSS